MLIARLASQLEESIVPPVLCLLTKFAHSHVKAKEFVRAIQAAVSLLEIKFTESFRGTFHVDKACQTFSIAFRHIAPGSTPSPACNQTTFEVKRI